MCPEKEGKSERGFTLIELLVVVSIITLLMALLFPALQRAKKQAQSAVCQSKLHQLGLIFSMYVDESGGRTPERQTVGGMPWWFPGFEKHPELVLCPSATRLLPGDGLAGDTFHAYPLLLGQCNLKGSYGLNAWIHDKRVKVDGKMVPVRHRDGYRHWGTCYVKQTVTIPVFFDCLGGWTAPDDTESPPECEGATNTCPYMWTVCIDRHNDGINTAFMDWSVRKVGLKELWTLKWHRQFDTAGPWTKAGGALPEDWPQWMRQFKDY